MLSSCDLPTNKVITKRYITDCRCEYSYYMSVGSSISKFTFEDSCNLHVGYHIP